MAITFANPFGSMVDGYERGQRAEIERRQYAADRVEQELTLLDKLVLEPNRELAKEQRQFAREMERMMARRSASGGRGRSGTGSEFGFNFSDPSTGDSVGATYNQDAVSIGIMQGGHTFPGLPAADPNSFTFRLNGGV